MPARDLSIILVHGNSEWYGSDRAFLSQAEALRADGWDVTIALPGEGALHARCVASGLSPIILESAPFRGRTFRWHELARYLAVDLPLATVRCWRVFRRFDIVDLNTSILLGAVLGSWLAGRPTVVHIRETYVDSPGMWRTYCSFLGRVVARLVATSIDIQSEVGPRHARQKTVVVSDGLDFGPVPLSPGASARVVMIGRINAWKGQEVLIEAIALLRSREIVVQVDIAGDVYPGQLHLRHRLTHQIETLRVADDVRLLGYVANVDALLADGPIFVLPSTRPEPFGLALLDAMGKGLSCIATDAGGPREIIRPGETGLLVPPGDASALADAIEYLLENRMERERLGAGAAIDVRERYSINRTARRLGEIYATLSNVPPPRRAAG